MDFNDRSPGKGGGAGGAGGPGGRRRRRRRRRGRRTGPENNNAPQAIIDPTDDRFKTSASAPTGPETLDSFNLFCAYHLGITRNNGYKFQSVREVANRFNTDPATIKRKLKQYGIESDTLRALGFEAEYAQLDIKVAPEGVSRRELAKDIWREYEDDIVELEPEPEPEPELEAEEAEAEEAEAEEAEGEADAELSAADETEADEADSSAEADESDESDEVEDDE